MKIAQVGAGSWLSHLHIEREVYAVLVLAKSHGVRQVQLEPCDCNLRLQGDHLC